MGLIFRRILGMGDFLEVARLNNIAASYNETGLIIEVGETRDIWEYGLWAYEANTCTVLKKFDRYEEHKKSAMGHGFDEYYSQVYESPHQQIDMLEPMKGQGEW